MSDHLKQQIKGKMQERARIEACIEECSARLQASGVGLKSKLVDAQVELHGRNSHVKLLGCAKA